LGREAGYSQQEVSVVELGKINTPIETLGRFAEALGVSLAALMGTPPRPPEVPVAVILPVVQDMRQTLNHIEGSLAGDPEAIQELRRKVTSSGLKHISIRRYRMGLLAYRKPMASHAWTIAPV